MRGLMERSVSTRETPTDPRTFESALEPNSAFQENGHCNWKCPLSHLAMDKFGDLANLLPGTPGSEPMSPPPPNSWSKLGMGSPASGFWPWAEDIEMAMVGTKMSMWNFLANWKHLKFKLVFDFAKANAFVSIHKFEVNVDVNSNDVLTIIFGDQWQ